MAVDRLAKCIKLIDLMFGLHYDIVLIYLNDVTFGKCFSAAGNTKQSAGTSSKPSTVSDVSVDVISVSSVDSKESPAEKDKSRKRRFV